MSTLRQVFDVGIKAHKEKGGGTLENPVVELKRMRVKKMSCNCRSWISSRT